MNKREERIDLKDLVGDIITVDVIKPKEGKFPVGIYKGVFCKLQVPKVVGFLEYGCTVEGFVLEAKEKYIVLDVMSVVKSSGANFKDNLDKILTVANKSKQERLKVKSPFLIYQLRREMV